MREGTLARKQWNREQIKMRRTGRKSRVLTAGIYCSMTLLKAVSWIYFLSPVVKFSLTQIYMEVDIDNLSTITTL